MKTNVQPERIKVSAGKRAYKMLADQAIGHDLLKGLLELITNSDDSYARLEAAGKACSGKIEIEVDRRPRTKKTIVRVVDWAEGMDTGQLRKCVGEYGEDTSGRIGRGVFGMGLKDCINAFGFGTIVSFKAGKYHECRLTNAEDLSLYPARLTEAEDVKRHRNHEGGTEIEITVDNPDIRIPLIDSLRSQLQTHVCLRGIMTDPDRRVVLRDKSGNAYELQYRAPEADIVLDAERLVLPSYPDVHPVLTVRRAKGPEALSQQGSSRTGGILLISRRTYHQATLFGFDDDPHASRLFGELRCDEIYDLQVFGQQIVDKNRDGLKKNHPFTKELSEAARKKIEALVAAERIKEKESERKLEEESTRRRFRDALKSLNVIASEELQVGGLGAGTGKETVRDPRSPEGGFEFIPDSYRIIVAERDKLKLRVQVDATTELAIGDKIEISSDNASIKLLEDGTHIPELYYSNPPLALVHVGIEGLQANAQGLITAKCGGKVAIALVEVVSTKEQRDRTPSGGLFKDIRYEARPDIPVRSRFDRDEGIIYINTLGPSVDLYFGKGYESQDRGGNQVLVAELVTEQACQEIGRRQREAKILDIPPGIEEWEAFNGHLVKLKSIYAPMIHKALVSADNRG